MDRIIEKKKWRKMSLIYKICEQTIEVVINQYYIVENSEKIPNN